MAKKTAMRARTSFLGPDRRVVQEGALVSSDDPIVKGRRDLFEPADDHVERATAAPGEKRDVQRADHACPVDGCDYTGTERGLKIHTTQAHSDDEG